jgi:signal transduction histidine kinase
MTLSLRMRVLLLVAVSYLVLFVGGGYYLKGRLAVASDEQSTQRVKDVLSTAVPAGFGPHRDLSVRTILRYSSWALLDDAVILGRQNLEVRPNGMIDAEGIDLNPVGGSRRDAHFERQEILRAIVSAMDTGRPVEVAGGLALPIIADRVCWGGCWFRYEGAEVFAEMFRKLLPLLLLAVLLFTAMTYWMLGQLVVRPVELLAGGARRVREGDLTVRITETSRRDELADLVRSFNQMTATVHGFNQKLEEEVLKATDHARRAEGAAMTQRRLAAMGELAAGIAHEINNPLGGLLNAVESLGREDLSSDRRRQYQQLVTRGLSRIGDTVNRLRRFTPRDAPLDPMVLSDVVQDSVDLVSHRARRLGVTIGWSPPTGGNSPVVAGARNEIGQALLNLLANALDALEEKGSRDANGPRIDVSLVTVEDGVLLRVRDNGPGVAPAELTKLPDLFYTTKDVGKGTGLGLALIHKTVRQHGGRVTLASELGAFFRAEIWLPSFSGESPSPGQEKS